MKLRHIINTVCMALLVMPIIADAQIYKWKDKNGVTRYSDTPPLGEKANAIGKASAAKPDVPAKDGAIKGDDNIPASKGEPPKQNGKVEDQPLDPHMAKAREEARKAELEKQKQEQSRLQAEANAENCRNARINYNTYMQGGRVYKANEKGERVYMSEAELKSGKKRARAAINKYCN